MNQAFDQGLITQGWLEFLTFRQESCIQVAGTHDLNPNANKFSSDLDLMVERGLMYGAYGMGKRYQLAPLWVLIAFVFSGF